MFPFIELYVYKFIQILYKVNSQVDGFIDVGQRQFAEATVLDLLDHVPRLLHLHRGVTVLKWLLEKNVNDIMRVRLDMRSGFDVYLRIEFIGFKLITYIQPEFV